MTDSNPTENSCACVRTSNKWAAMGSSTFQKIDGWVWWIAPSGIRADLRKTTSASVFFQADCQDKKKKKKAGVGWGWGREQRGRVVVGRAVGRREGIRDRLHVLNS